jgi:hypothetical protein
MAPTYGSAKKAAPSGKNFFKESFLISTDFLVNNAQNNDLSFISSCQSL